MIHEVSIGKQIQVRQADIQDAERIANLCEQLEYDVTNGEIEDRLTKIQHNNAHIIYVATLANEYVIGWAHAYICDLIIMPTQAMLLGLVVDKDYRHQGIGHYLMQQIEEWAALAGCEDVILRSNIKRKEAHFFMKKLVIQISNNL